MVEARHTGGLTIPRVQSLRLPASTNRVAGLFVFLSLIVRL
jgi:hypothetical protein